MVILAVSYDVFYCNFYVLKASFVQVKGVGYKFGYNNEK